VPLVGAGPQAPWGAPPAPRTSSTGLWIALAATVVVAVLVVVAVVVTRGGGDSDPVASTTAATTATAPTTDPTSDPTSASSVPTETATADAGSATDALLARLPGDFEERDCTEYQLPDDGAEAAVECGAAISGTGPEAARFYAYPDVDTLRDAFEGDVDGLDLDRVDVDAGCPGNPGWLDYNDTSGQEAGSVACYIDGDGFGIVFWTQEDALAEGYVAVADGATNLATLWDWWKESDKSDFRTG
jgi:serine/threonine-protein kinase